MVDRSQFHGMDTESSREGARQLDSGATEVQGMLDLANQAIQALRSSPYGAAGPGFAQWDQTWTGEVNPQLQRAVENLRSNASELNRRAQMQEEASA